MKRCLILGVLFALAASANATQGDGVRQQAVQEVKTKARAAQQAPAPAPVRHLSEQERVELRRQLQQFNQQYIRRQ